jgi:hypothetical protein
MSCRRFQNDAVEHANFRACLNNASGSAHGHERPTKLELVINVEAATVFDVSIPSPALATADEVIE